MLLEALSGHRGAETDANILHWIIAAQGVDIMNINMHLLANQLLFLATAATRSTAITVVNALFDLATHPEWQESVRLEVGDALTTCGGWNLKAIQTMKKLDSFLKESTRLNNHLLREYPTEPSLGKTDALRSIFQPYSPATVYPVNRGEDTCRYIYIHASVLGGKGFQNLPSRR
jgi:hypothetical protein